MNIYSLKHYIYGIIAFLIISAWIYSEYNRYIFIQNQEEKHEKFFKEMREFANRGGRFTSEDGINFCEALNAHHGNKVKQLDCEELIER